MKTKTSKLDALIFIDTNIFLDFYRMGKSEINLKYLREIEKYKDILILTSQVEMEFSKNRQSVILDFLKQSKSTLSKPSVPSIFVDAKAVKLIEEAQIKSPNNKAKSQKALIDS